jgi:decaprenyl-phosphate phosphoribosyltransferase
MQEKAHPNYIHYINAMRLNRWPRSFSIIVGFLAALYTVGIAGQNFISSGFNFILAFCVTFLICIANYIINEIVDAPTDYFHPVKHSRPVVSGNVSIKVLLLIALLFCCTAFTLSLLFFKYTLIASLFALLIMGFLYNIRPIRLKDILYLDAISESANNPIRFLIGWYAVNPGQHPSLLYLVCWWAIGAFLMFGKRLSEKKIFKEDEAKLYRKSLGIYTESSLAKSMVISSAVFFTAFLVVLIDKLNTYNVILLPVSIVYIIWILYEAWKGKYLIDEPEVILKQPAFIFLMLLILAFILLSFFP